MLEPCLWALTWSSGCLPSPPKCSPLPVTLAEGGVFLGASLRTLWSPSAKDEYVAYGHRKGWGSDGGRPARAGTSGGGPGGGRKISGMDSVRNTGPDSTSSFALLALHVAPSQQPAQTRAWTPHHIQTLRYPVPTVDSKV